MIIIGITGRARSGKGTVAQAIQEACVDRFDCKIFEISEYVLNDLRRIGKLPRVVTRVNILPDQLETMVMHGIARRKLDPYYWLNQVFNDMELQKPEVALLPNIRFKNEAEFVRQANGPGSIIRVKSFLSDGIEYISQDRDPNSIMETEQLKVEADYFLTAKRGEIELLKLQAKTLFNHICEKNIPTNK